MNQQIELEVFFDGACPLCRKEISMIRRLDRRHRILFTDISEPEFDIKIYGKSMDQLMEEIHARLPDGTWVTGVEVFRRLYSAIGCRWLVLPTRLPGISHFLDLTYRVFAKNRLKLTGRCHSNGACEMSPQSKEVRT
ncbi:hypothetical protein Pan241w_19270 [Gimesia alba]|uniref:Thiol-disulfide oxidoreductase n=1 Tax=Gimesia alba TaxID=2527973 RepID=A0A517RD99_9PLAN|nr:DUF393 domain-containing protein [Gimesia alba]QDT41859.1 hypothetical protein Pan241w_19270 [Gimesia alba]